MKIRMEIPLLVAGLLAGFLCLLLSASLYFSYPAPCDLPCVTPGKASLTKNPTVTFAKVYEPKCQPLRLELQLHEPKARINKHYTLWYRLALENVCCGRVDAQVGDFLYDRGGQVRFRIWGPDGKEIPYRAGTDKIPSEYGTIRPYSPDDEFNAELIERAYNGFLTLEPGTRLWSSPSKLAPWNPAFGGHASYEEMRLRFPKLQVMYDKLIAKRNAQMWRKVRELNVPTPPKGFKILYGHVFQVPGKHRIQAVYEDEVDVSEPLLKLSKLPNLFRGILSMGAELLGREGREKNSYFHAYAESEIFEIEVLP